MKFVCLVFYILPLLLLTFAKSVRHDEICGEFNGRRMYLELGERGILTDVQNNDRVERNVAPHRQCSLELITCPSCIISVKFMFLNISRNCGKNSVLDSCGCDYVWIYEPPFEDVSGEQFCGHFVQSNTSSLIYKSQTRSTAITFLYSSFHQHAFTLEYSSERNRHFLDGYPRYSNNNNNTQFISSPFFPYFYPRDLNTEYIISCKSSENCRIRLIFTDFQISTSSLIEFFDWNGQRMHVTTGTIFRPPLITSTGPTMVIRFYANGGTNLGFKAAYTFLLGETDNSTLKPNTDCGGFVDNLGGGITMMNIIKESTKSYDCFWIIHPPESYLHLKTQLYLKIIAFSDFAGTTELIIRQGLTSNEPVLEVLRHPVSHYVLSKQKEHIVPISQGYYVSLKGLFHPQSRLAIIYSAFNYKDCFSGSDFLCRNLRCIPAYLICDGFDHCGDNSDETTTCLKEAKDRIRWTHTPNFFFPKIDKYSYLKTATIVFVVCSLGLISLIFALIILLYRINFRNRNQRQLQTHLQTINNMLEEGPRGSLIEEILIPDEPPIYEAPPDYEEVLKKYKNIEKKKPKKSKRSSTQTKRPCSRCDNSETEVSDIPDENLLLANDLIASTSRSCQTTPLPTSIPIPKTPPPLYTSLPRIEIRNEFDRVTNDRVDQNFETGGNANNNEVIKVNASNSEVLEGNGSNNEVIRENTSINVCLNKNTKNIEESSRSVKAKSNTERGSLVLNDEGVVYNNVQILENVATFSVLRKFNMKPEASLKTSQLKYRSLQNVNKVSSTPRKFRSLDLFNLNDAFCNRFKFKSRIKIQRKLCVSDSELFVMSDYGTYNESAFNGINDDGVKNSRLRRSVSIENLFKL